MTTKSIYIIDTNILLNDASILKVFEAGSVILPITTLEELDHFKRDLTDRGVNARQASEHLEALFQNFPGLNNQQHAIGVTTAAGGTLSFHSCRDEDTRDFPKDLLSSKGDESILAIAKKAQQRYLGQKVIIVSKDRNLRLRATMLGIDSQDFPYFKCPETIHLTKDILTDTEKSEFKFTAYAINTRDKKIYRAKPTDTYTEIKIPHGSSKPYPKCRTLQQYCALEAMLDPEISEIAIVGPQKSGKTLLVLKALLNHTVEFNKLRSVPWQTSAYLTKPTAYLNNVLELEFIRESYEDLLKAYWPANELDLQKDEIQIIEYGTLPIHHGRRIAQRVLVIDDAQNLTTSELRAVRGSLGENSKLILLGNLDKIYNPYISKESSGLTAFIMEQALCESKVVVELSAE